MKKQKETNEVSTKFYKESWKDRKDQQILANGDTPN